MATYKAEHIAEPVLSFPANVELATPKRFVKILSTGKLVYAGAGEQAIGVLQFGIEANRMATVITNPSVALVEAGGNVTIGASAVSDASGKAVEATELSISVPVGATPVTSDAAQPTLVVAGSALTEKILGIFLDSGADGDLVRVKLK